jgi:hypothetical protein
MSEGKRVNIYDLTVRDIVNMNKILRDSILDRIRRIEDNEEEDPTHPDLVHHQVIGGKFLEIIAPPE